MERLIRNMLKTNSKVIVNEFKAYSMLPICSTTYPSYVVLPIVD